MMYEKEISFNSKDNFNYLFDLFICIVARSNAHAFFIVNNNWTDQGAGQKQYTILAYILWLMFPELYFNIDILCSHSRVHMHVSQRNAKQPTWVGKNLPKYDLA